ncbi:saccharopine dehydrogenase oxidoreductase-like [Tropilaelaps mercedesae]|uniref:Saccharopine dehydrogenase oxidoreductase-like n=1 Tax=Tropilaelaps mercedesae TaxID=418985 RepID=A0A1V9XG46_9ACAR|nr:saccharopine dehydrogenase oxidoreductase-like [Tropilaelaps mercedesae]
MTSSTQENGKHAPGWKQDFGQSLYIKYQPLLLVNSRMDVTAKEVVKHWYHRGATRYDHSIHPDVLHTQGSAFSQLVWRESTELGIGKARSIHNEAKVIVVGVYTPRGNVAGLFVDNVRPYVKAHTTPSASDVSDDEQDEGTFEARGNYPRLTKRLSTLTQLIDAVLH